MTMQWLFTRLSEGGDAPAIVWRDRCYSYADLLEAVSSTHADLARCGVEPGSVWVLDADYTPRGIGLLLAAMAQGCVVAPLAGASPERCREVAATIEAGHLFRLGQEGDLAHARLAHEVHHPLTLELLERGRSGLVLLTSGSSGQPRAALHDLERLMRRYTKPRPAQRILTFLLFDHIGGFNTLMHTLAHGGCVVVPDGRDPRTVCEAIERHRVQVLPTSPTFLNLMLISEAWRGLDLSSLERITYGTEVMPAATLARLRRALPQVRLMQTYGSTELGILRSVSREDGSLWVRVGGEDYETRVVDGQLHVRARCSMLGYLNAPSPFDADGWLNTGDRVEVDGDWLRFLGRAGDVVNVGGLKVHPTEVETVLLECDDVVAATAQGTRHPLMGQVVTAAVQVAPGAVPQQVVEAARQHCRARLERHKIPVKIRVADGLCSNRFKTVREAS